MNFYSRLQTSSGRSAASWPNDNDNVRDLIGRLVLARSDDLDIVIMWLRFRGHSNREIGEFTDMSHQNVARRLASLRERSKWPDVKLREWAYRRDNKMLPRMGATTEHKIHVLRTMRENGLHQWEAAQMFGVSKSTIARWKSEIEGEEV